MEWKRRHPDLIRFDHRKMTDPIVPGLNDCGNCFQEVGGRKRSYSEKEDSGRDILSDPKDQLPEIFVEGQHDSIFRMGLM